MSVETLQAVAWRFRWREIQGYEIEIDIDALVEFVLEETSGGSDVSESDSESGELKSILKEESKMAESKIDDDYVDEDWGESKDENIQGKRHRTRSKRKSSWRMSKIAPPPDPEPSVNLNSEWPLSTLCSFEIFSKCRYLLVDKLEQNGLSALQLAAMRGFLNNVIFNTAYLSSFF